MWLNVGLTINNLWQAIAFNHLATTHLVTVYSTVTNTQIWGLGLLCISSVILLIPQWQIRQRLKNVMNLLVAERTWRAAYSDYCCGILGQN